jgi:hypothetical protein
MQTILLGYRVEVQDLDSQGVATVAITYTSAEFHVKSPSAEVNYDSTQPSTTPPPGAGPLTALIGQGFSARISAAGRVEEVDGLDALLKAVSARLNLPEGPTRTAAEKRLARQLSEPNVKALVQLIFAPLPDHPAGLGENWYHKNSLSLGFPLTLETTYTLKGSDNGIATIEVAGRSNTAPNALIDAGQLKMTYDLHGDLRGQMQIEESTGWPIASGTTQFLAGGVAFDTHDASVQVVPISIESTMKVEEERNKGVDEEKGQPDKG